MSRDLDRRVAEKLGWKVFVIPPTGNHFCLTDATGRLTGPVEDEREKCWQYVPEYSTCHTAVQELVEVVRGWKCESRLLFYRKIGLTPWQGMHEGYSRIDKQDQTEFMAYDAGFFATPHDICTAFLEVCE